MKVVISYGGESDKKLNKAIVSAMEKLGFDRHEDVELPAYV